MAADVVEVRVACHRKAGALGNEAHLFHKTLNARAAVNQHGATEEGLDEGLVDVRDTVHEARTFHAACREAGRRGVPDDGAIRMIASCRSGRPSRPRQKVIERTPFPTAASWASATRPFVRSLNVSWKRLNLALRPESGGSAHYLHGADRHRQTR